MLKNENNFVKQLSSDFIDRYKLCNYNKLDIILFIRRLNNMGYVIAKSDDIETHFKPVDLDNFKKTIVKWKVSSKDDVSLYKKLNTRKHFMEYINEIIHKKKE